MNTREAIGVVLVDDDKELLAELAEGLTIEGFSTHVCVSAEHAVATLKAQPKVLYLVTDINMPGIDGLELIAKINIFRERLPVTTFVMTGAASTERAIAALRLGVTEFFLKPLDAIEITAAIRRREQERRGVGTREIVFSRAQVCARLLTTRKEIRRSLGAELFSEGTWDMLLELMTAEEAGDEISTTSLVHGAELPMTTALRRIESLEEAGIIERYPDTVDRRRILIRLTEIGSRKVCEVVDRMIDRLAQGQETR